MRKHLILVGLILAAVAVMARTNGGVQNKTAVGNAMSDSDAIRKVYDAWAKTFRVHDIAGIMSFYAPGDDVVAYDIVPPLQYRGKDAYRKDYEDFLAQVDGPIEVEYRDLRVVAGHDVAFVHALERFQGMLKNGQKMDLWLRATSGLRKINGKWLIVHDHISVPADLDSGKAALDLQP